MKSHRRFLLAALLASGLLTGCSSVFPGMSFDGSVPSRNLWEGSPAAKYQVIPISPQLLYREALTNRAHNVGKSNPVLEREIQAYRYMIEPRDVLSIVIWGAPNANSVFTPMGAPGVAVNNIPAASGFRVNGDGMIYFPYVGNVEVAGKTTDQIRASLTERLKPYIQNPQVTVDVSEFNSEHFQLAGVVAKSGLYPITNIPLTVSQAIAAAGGVLPQVTTSSSTNLIARPLGDLSHVIYVHNRMSEVLNLRALEQYGDASQDRLVKPGDTIVVPDNSFEQVHLIGEVRNPGNYPLNNSELNLAQLLGDAGGLDPTTANAERIFVFRGAYQKPEIFWIDASSPDAMLLANGFALEPQDVVYVATAGLASWDRVINQILPTVQTVYFAKVLTQ